LNSLVLFKKLRDKCRNHYNKGKKLYLSKKYKEALEEFSQIDTKCMGNFDEGLVHHYSALCYANLRKYKKSIQEFRLAIKFRKDYGKIHLDKGLTHYFFYTKNMFLDVVYRIMGLRNGLEEALRCFEEGLLVDSGNCDLWYYRGYMLELLGKHKKAKESYEKCISCNRKISNYESSRVFRKIKRK
jgi:tetratricopeptide (TPR) repeat protein